MKISELINGCSESILTNSSLNEIRGGDISINTTCVKDENSDSNGDGIADDCNMHVDDSSELEGVAVGRN